MLFFCFFLKNFKSRMRKTHYLYHHIKTAAQNHSVLSALSLMATEVSSQIVILAVFTQQRLHDWNSAIKSIDMTDSLKTASRILRCLYLSKPNMSASQHHLIFQLNSFFLCGLGISTKTGKRRRMLPDKSDEG